MSAKRKIRAEFRKGHQGKARRGDLTRELARDDRATDKFVSSERVSGKGDLTRKRTIVGLEGDEGSGLSVVREIGDGSLRGRVLSVHGLASQVRSDDGRLFRCATRRVLKNISTDQRHVVAAGDIVYFRAEDEVTGLIERIEPRKSVLCRTSRKRQHVLVANVDQVIIVSSAAEPVLKPNLIDRMLVEAERNRVRPILCINKIDLIEPADLQPLAGVFGQMGYQVLLVSAERNIGMDPLRRLLAGKASVVAGQSGVGKSSLLNAVEPGLGLKVADVSEENQKGKHTTTTAQIGRAHV